jgi:PAS domain S-box-containing protein
MESLEEFVGLLDHVTDVVAIVDDDGQICTVNDAAERLFGYDRADLVGTPMFEHVHPDDRAVVESAFGRVVDADESATESVTHRYRDSEGRWLWLESHLSNSGDDTVDGYVVSARDVSREIA